MGVRWMDDDPIEIDTFGPRHEPETRAHVLRHLLSVIRTGARRRARRPPPPCEGCCQECGVLLPGHRLRCSHVRYWPGDSGEQQ